MCIRDSNLSMRLDISSRFMNINEPCNMNATGEIYDFSKMHPYSCLLYTSGKRQMSITLSPGCHTNKYVYTFKQVTE